MKKIIFLTILVLCTLGLGLIYYQLQLASTAQKVSAQNPVMAMDHSRQDIASQDRLRVVWVQDMGDGSDGDAKGGNLRLMGLDTGDGKGERAILETVGNYAKPLMTPQGDRVVYSDRVRKKAYVGNRGWSLAEVELFTGFALALWVDPRDNRGVGLLWI